MKNFWWKLLAAVAAAWWVASLFNLLDEVTLVNVVSFAAVTSGITWVLLGTQQRRVQR